MSDAAVNKRKALARAAAAGAIGLAAVGGLAAFAGPAQAADWPGTAGAVYTMTIAGFWLGDRGLRPIPGSVQPLGSGALVPKQIQFSNDARALVVDEAGSTTIDTFVVGRDGRPGPGSVQPLGSGALVPKQIQNQIVGYRVGADGSLTQVTTVPVATGSAGVGAS